MDVIEVIERKFHLEGKILSLLREFEKETKLTPISLSLERVSVSRMCELKEESVMTQVKVEVSL